MAVPNYTPAQCERVMQLYAEHPEWSVTDVCRVASRELGRHLCVEQLKRIVRRAGKAYQTKGIVEPEYMPTEAEIQAATEQIRAEREASGELYGRRHEASVPLRVYRSTWRPGRHDD